MMTTGTFYFTCSHLVDKTVLIFTRRCLQDVLGSELSYMLLMWSKHAIFCKVLFDHFLSTILTAFLHIQEIGILLISKTNITYPDETPHDASPVIKRTNLSNI